MPDRPDSRTPAQQSARFYPVMAKPPVDPDATDYDGRIADVEQEIGNHNIATPEGYLAWLKQRRDEKLAARDMAELDTQPKMPYTVNSLVGIIIRVSGVRVPPPLLASSAVSQRQIDACSHQGGDRRAGAPRIASAVRQ
jgi:hypothetical protein